MLNLKFHQLKLRFRIWFLLWLFLLLIKLCFLDFYIWNLFLIIISFGIVIFLHRILELVLYFVNWLIPLCQCLLLCFIYWKLTFLLFYLEKPIVIQLIFLYYHFYFWYLQNTLDSLTFADLNRWIIIWKIEFRNLYFLKNGLLLLLKSFALIF